MVMVCYSAEIEWTAFLFPGERQPMFGVDRSVSDNTRGRGREVRDEDVRQDIEGQRIFFTRTIIASLLVVFQRCPHWLLIWSGVT